MRRWLTLSLVIGGVLSGVQGAWAQEDDDNGNGFGIGIGLVNLDESFADDTELYYTANFRFAVGERAGGRGWRGMVEPEVGYWDADTAEDLVAGVNFIGVLPHGGVQFFVGGGLGLHFLDAEVLVDDEIVSTDDELFGVNAQSGVDVRLNDTVSVFATGRFDIVEDTDSLQTKAYVGLRFGT